jgi:membrane protein implicated in regulation of membrane protease activity
MILIVFIILSLFVPWPWNLLVLAGGVIAEVGEVIWGRRLARRWRAKTGVQTMIGSPAEVVAPCRPTGQVRVHGELWGAICHDGADVGDTVRIDAIDELTLTVTAWEGDLPPQARSRRRSASRETTNPGT